MFKRFPQENVKRKKSLGVLYVNELESNPVTARMSRPLTTTQENTAEQRKTNAVCIKVITGWSVNFPSPLSLYCSLVFQSNHMQIYLTSFIAYFFKMSNKARMSKFHVGGFYLNKGI